VEQVAPAGSGKNNANTGFSNQLLRGGKGTRPERTFARAKKTPYQKNLPPGVFVGKKTQEKRAGTPGISAIKKGDGLKGRPLSIFTKGGRGSPHGGDFNLERKETRKKKKRARGGGAPGVKKDCRPEPDHQVFHGPSH